MIFMLFNVINNTRCVSKRTFKTLIQVNMKWRNEHFRDSKHYIYHRIHKNIISVSYIVDKRHKTGHMSHLYFSASTAAKADRYLSIAACATGVKSSPM